MNHGVSNICVVTAVCFALPFVTIVFVGASEIYPLGDPRRCLGNANKGVKILDVLPGSGWDNLQNTEAGMVLGHNYSKCRTTEDQQFIIPDFSTVITLKTYLWVRNEDVIDSSTNGVSITALGVNMDSHMDGEFDISGAFSGDYRQVKTNYVQDMSITNRIQRRYVAYKTVIQPEMPLTWTFRVKLMTIAQALEAGDTRRARYDSQQLVKDYGTHVIIGVEAGTVWIQEDSISNEVLNTSSQSQPMVSITPEVSATTNISQANISMSGYTRSNDGTNTSTTNNSTVSTMRSFGGSPGTYPNMSEKDWVESFTNNLVAVDRTGEPLDSLIQAETLPDLAQGTLLQLNNLIKESIQSYYKINTYPGCTDKNAANFSPQANADDGSCWKDAPPQRNTTIRFGGVYQTCNVSVGTDEVSRDLCSGRRRVNPATGLPTCPEGYETVPLYRKTEQHQQVFQQCESCWLGLFNCCSDVLHPASAEILAFWCFHVSHNVSTDEDVNNPNIETDNDLDSEDDELPEFPGFLFGGTFTSQVTNILTSAKTCSRGFLPLTLADDIHICVSDGGEEEERQAVDFAGFFSCSAGETLVIS
ncbi:hypothetical protein EGW08_012095 [Elysia chlorotica]|uniref:MACPF domain-containing protein n=1 Tax=Elysia chlorotica TaxID=188477 RepID=A0A3S0ZKW3_ELYCH|nr:hypothetical protein EGW08_012095 [Elysia chlorotica]